MRQIETLLGYPKVGPLSPSAIAINLGTEEDTIQPDLDSLAQQGRIIRLRDGRLTVPGHAGRRDVPARGSVSVITGSGSEGFYLQEHPAALALPADRRRPGAPDRGRESGPKLRLPHL